MALMAYWHCKGQKQGQMKGSITQKGREGTIGVIAFTHEIVSPRDIASGLATGKRMHKPFVLTCELDQSAPLQYSALCNNESLTDCKLEMYRPSPTGAEKLYFTVELKNATLASIAMKMPNNKHPELTKFETYCDYSYTYQSITWTWTDGGISAVDDWQSPVS